MKHVPIRFSYNFERPDEKRGTENYESQEVWEEFKFASPYENFGGLKSLKLPETKENVVRLS